nr:root phototropism protein 2 [Ipomoea batatas]GMD25025.1 root phototropism protein 2 [Ipomoea batatas]
MSAFFTRIIATMRSHGAKPLAIASAIITYAEDSDEYVVEDRHVEVDVVCPLCCQYPESLKHLMCECMHVVPLWQSQGGGPLPDISEDFGAWLARQLLNDDTEADSTMPGNNSLASPPMHAMIIPDDGVAVLRKCGVSDKLLVLSPHNNHIPQKPAPAAKRAREEDIGDPRALKCQCAALKQKRPPTTSGELSFFFDAAGVQSSNSVHLCSCCS